MFVQPARCLTLLLLCFASIATGADDSAIDLFHQRIMPIFKSPNPSSCVQCHLSSVDLKDYILPSHEETFLSLRSQGLIDVDNPKASKILKLIDMGEDDSDRQAKMIHAKTRKAEYDAFAAWVDACCHDVDLRNRPVQQNFVPAKPAVSDQVIRHARKDRVLDSFVRNIWSQRMRCFPCHTPDDLERDNPQHEKPRERHREFVKTHGAKMNIFADGPEATMRAMITSSRRPSKKHLPMLNLTEPKQSLLVLKPTAKLPPKNADGEFEKPSSLTPVSHMGGLKMHVDDQSYKTFLAWIEDYSRIASEEYKTANDLPRDNWYPSKHLLRINELPQDWKAMSRVQLFVHAKDDRSDGWSSEPIAFTQSLVTPRKVVIGSLFLLRSKSGHDDWDRDGVTLKPGRYQVKIYIDTEGKLDSDPTLFLGEDEFLGSIEFDAHWGEGFKNAEVVSAKSLQ